MPAEEGFEPMSLEQAWVLLIGGDVGRIGLSMGAMPVIFPVHYAVEGGCIVVRAAAGSSIASAAAGSVVAFAVDDYERQDSSGWSVLAVGRSEVVQDPGSQISIKPELVFGRRRKATSAY